MKVRSQVADLGLDREVRRLGLLLKNTTGACLAFALYRDVAQREAVVRELQRRLPLPLYELALSPERRDSVGLLRELLPEVERRCEAAARHDGRLAERSFRSTTWSGPSRRPWDTSTSSGSSLLKYPTLWSSGCWNMACGR